MEMNWNECKYSIDEVSTLFRVYALNTLYTKKQAATRIKRMFKERGEKTYWYADMAVTSEMAYKKEW